MTEEDNGSTPPAPAAEPCRECDMVDDGAPAAGAPDNVVAGRVGEEGSSKEEDDRGLSVFEVGLFAPWPSSLPFLLPRRFLEIFLSISGYSSACDVRRA